LPPPAASLSRGARFKVLQLGQATITASDTVYLSCLEQCLTRAGIARWDHALGKVWRR
jgi:hypothetical protein